MALRKEDKELLYWAYKNRYFGNSFFSLGAAISEFKEKYDREELEKTLDNITSEGYFYKKPDLHGEYSYQIPNIKKAKEIKKILRYHRLKDWSKQNLTKSLKFFADKFADIAVSIVTSVITAYITVKFIT